MSKEDIKKLFKKIELEVKKMSSKELLDYSKTERDKKHSLDIKMYDFTMDIIQERTEYLNSQSDKVLKCRDSDMIKKYQKKVRGKK